MKPISLKRSSLLIVTVFALMIFFSNAASFAASEPQIKVFYKLVSAGPEISYSFYVQNVGSSSFNLKDLRLRYWYTKDSSAEQTARYCTNDIKNLLAGRFVTVPGYSKADNYFELDFKNYTDYTLAPSAKSFVTDVTIKKSGTSTYNQTNDYSIITNATVNFVLNTKITGYINGIQQICGSEPDFASGPNYVTMLFSKENFTGKYATLKVGKYDTEALEDLDLEDDCINSLLIKKGYKVIFYRDDDFKGPNFERTVNDPSFVNNNFANMISSVIVMRIGDRIEDVDDYNSGNGNDCDNDEDDEDDNDDDSDSTPRPTTTYVVTSTPAPTATPIPTATATRIPGAVVTDLAVSLSSDKMKYSDGQIITYTIDYKNKYNLETGNVIIKGEIPEYTELVDKAGGTINGNTIQWTFPSLQPLYNGRIIYQVKVKELPKPEIYASNTVSITSTEDQLENTGDDISSIKVLLFSNKQNVGSHSLYIVGYPDKLFKPENNITRAEVATIFSRISGIDYPSQEGGVFTDVPSSRWASGFIATATRQLGLFNGYPDGSFRPNEPITRAELAIVTTKFLKTGSPAPFVIHFNDSSNHWAKNFIEEAYRYKLVTGYSDGTFRPDDNIKRSELVTMVNKMLYRGPLIVTNPSFPDVGPAHWAYGQVEEASKNHKFTRDPFGNETISN